MQGRGEPVIFLFAIPMSVKHTEAINHFYLFLCLITLAHMGTLLDWCLVGESHIGRNNRSNNVVFSNSQTYALLAIQFLHLILG